MLEFDTKILKDPETIAQDVARSRDGGSPVREPAPMDRLWTQIADWQRRIARRTGSIEGEDIAAPLVAELFDLSHQKKGLENGRNDLQHRITDAEFESPLPRDSHVAPIWGVEFRCADLCQAQRCAQQPRRLGANNI